MPRRSSKTPPNDPNVAAHRAVLRLTEGEDHLRHLPSEGPGEKPPKNPAAVALGRLGGKRGGKARAANLSPERRSQIARNAAAKRWRKDPEENA